MLTELATLAQQILMNSQLGAICTDLFYLANLVT